jgi:hypothetical protein
MGRRRRRMQTRGLVRKREENRHEDVDVGGRIILKWILDK